MTNSLKITTTIKSNRPTSSVYILLTQKSLQNRTGQTGGADYRGLVVCIVATSSCLADRGAGSRCRRDKSYLQPLITYHCCSPQHWLTTLTHSLNCAVHTYRHERWLFIQDEAKGLLRLLFLLVYPQRDDNIKSVSPQHIYSFKVTPPPVGHVGPIFLKLNFKW